MACVPGRAAPHDAAFARHAVDFRRNPVGRGLLVLAGSWKRAGGRTLRVACLLAISVTAKATAATTEPEERPHYMRPALEIGAGLAAASAWYVLDRRNVFDWDRPSARQRFNGEAWRFDNNPFPINFIWHPLSGSGMYALARGNRLGVWSSFVYVLAGSSVWEFAIEFNEKVSISDLIATPGAGLVIGEFAHKLAMGSQ